MFEIYNDDVKSEDLELYTFGNLEDVIQRGAPLNQSFCLQLKSFRVLMISMIIYHIINTDATIANVVNLIKMN